MIYAAIIAGAVLVATYLMMRRIDRNE